MHCRVLFTLRTRAQGAVLRWRKGGSKFLSYIRNCRQTCFPKLSTSVPEYKSTCPIHSRQFQLLQMIESHMSQWMSSRSCWGLNTLEQAAYTYRKSANSISWKEQIDIGRILFSCSQLDEVIFNSCLLDIVIKRILSYHPLRNRTSQV